MPTPKILVIDNDEGWCKILQEPLVSLGYPIEIQRNRTEALDRILSEPFEFDVVVLNVRLDNSNGDDIPRKWIILMEQIRKKDREVIVVTSQKYPPDIRLSKIIGTAYNNYKVANFIFKEEFDQEDYQSSVKQVIQRRLTKNFKADLIRLLAQQNEWQSGRVQDRSAMLLLAGLPPSFVNTLQLDGTTDGSAATIITHLAELSYMVESPDYTPLGLVVKLLYARVIDIENKTCCARILLDHGLTKDGQLLQEIRTYLA